MRQPGAGDLDQRRRDQQVGSGRLEVPGQPAQLLGAEVGAGQHGDRVGVGQPDRLLDGAEAADDRHAALHQRGPLAGQRQARGHDLQAVEALVAEAAQHLEDGQLVADHDHPVQEVAVGAPAVQPLAQAVPAGEGEDRDERQADEHEQPGDLDLGGVGGEGDQRGQRDAGPGDPAELLGPDPEEPRLVGPVERDREHPHDRQERP